MKKSTIAVLFFLVSLMTTSCSKMETLFTNGEPVTEQRSLEHSFDAIKMFNNVNVKLVQDNHPRLELTCPKNLIDKVTTELDGNTLVIKNENDLNWLRSYDYSIDLTVYYDSLYQVNFASIGEFRCAEPIKGFSTLTIDTTETSIDSVWTRCFYLFIDEGCGDIDLDFDCHVVKCIFGNGTSKVTLRGKAEYTEINMRSYGTVHAENLYSNFVRVQSHSTNDAYVWPRSILRVWIYSDGNVYYKGHPWIWELNEGNGQIIKLE